MTEYVYGDVLFIINFSMDFLCLFIAGRLTKTKLKTWRVALGAALGSVYGVVSLLYSLPTVIETVVEIAAAFVVCSVGIGSGGLYKRVLQTAVFYAVSVMLGGVMTLIYSKLGKYAVYMETGGSIATALGDVPLWVFLACAAASALLTKLFAVLLKNRSRAKTCELSLSFDGKTHELTGFIDSGNVVADPISGTPVIFLSSRYRGVVPCLDVSDGADVLRANLTRGLRAIPVSTEGGSGVIFAVKADRCYVRTGGEYESRNALVAVGKEEYYCDCDALVPLELI